MDIIIERKTGDDFLSSVKSGRIYQQVEQMKQFDHAVICIIMNNIWKSFYFSRGRYIHKLYFGAIRSLAVNYQVPVITFYDEDDFLRFVSQAADKVTIDNREPQENITSLKRRKGCEVQVDQLPIGDYLIWRDDNKKSSHKSTEILRKPKSLQERKENALSCAEGVSINTAKLLLEEFGSIHRVGSVGINKLMTVKGIGRKTAENIYLMIRSVKVK